MIQDDVSPSSANFVKDGNISSLYHDVVRICDSFAPQIDFARCWMFGSAFLTVLRNDSLCHRADDIVPAPEHDNDRVVKLTSGDLKWKIHGSDEGADEPGAQVVR
jgi:hypothetical protein